MFDVTISRSTRIYFYSIEETVFRVMWRRRLMPSFKIKCFEGGLAGGAGLCLGAGLGALLQDLPSGVCECGEI